MNIFQRFDTVILRIFRQISILTHSFFHLNNFQLARFAVAVATLVFAYVGCEIRTSAIGIIFLSCYISIGPLKYTFEIEASQENIEADYWGIRTGFLITGLLSLLFLDQIPELPIWIAATLSCHYFVACVSKPSTPA